MQSPQGSGPGSHHHTFCSEDIRLQLPSRASLDSQSPRAAGREGNFCSCAVARFPQDCRDWWEWGWEVSFPGLCPAGQVTLDKTRVVEEPASLAPSLLSRGNKRAGVQERGRRGHPARGPSWCGQATGSRLLLHGWVSK